MSLWFLSALVREDLLKKKTIPLPLTGLFHKWATLLTLFILLLGCIHLGVRTFLLTHRRTDLALWMAKDDVSALVLQKSFLSAVRKSARNPFLHEAAGIQKRREKNDAEALIHYQNAAQYAPFRATYQFQMGEIYFAQKNYQKALESYHAAIHLEPNYWNAYDRLVQLLIQMKQPEKADVMQKYFTKRYRHISQKYRDSSTDLYSKQILSYDPVKNLEK
jgi:tetratricopeptide (TPR) repeat protein